MNLRQLEIFVQVVELGGFSQAARVLDVAQSHLSRQVRALETDLHEALFLRNGRGVVTTEAGRRLYDHGVAILQSVALARDDIGGARDEPAGSITIGLPHTVGRQLTVPLVDGFRRRMPRARLAIVEGLSSHIVEWIAGGRVDIGLLYNPQPQSTLAITPLLHEALCLVERVGTGVAIDGGPAGAAHRRPTCGSVPMKSLAQLPLIVPERSHVIRRLLETQAVLIGLKLDIAWEVSGVGSIIDLVCAGYGHAVLTASAVAASGRADELQARPLTDPPLASVLCLALAGNKRPGPVMRHAAALLTELVRSLPQATAAHSRPG